MRERMLQLSAASIMLTCMAAAGAQAPATVPAKGQVQITAEKMCCQGCARKVSGQLYTVKGVKSVSVDLPAHTVTVSVPRQDPATLGALCLAVQKGVGGPTTVATSAAAYKLVPADENADQARKLGGTQHVVIHNLHCQGCARKIAAQLYTIKGVSKVEVDMQRETLIVQARQNANLSPWQTVAAVAKAEERPVAVSGAFGTLSIEYSQAAAPKNHQALQSISGGIQR